MNHADILVNLCLAHASLQCAAIGIALGPEAQRVAGGGDGMGCALVLWLEASMAPLSVSRLQDVRHVGLRLVVSRGAPQIGVGSWAKVTLKFAQRLGPALCSGSCASASGLPKARYSAHCTRWMWRASWISGLSLSLARERQPVGLQAQHAALRRHGHQADAGIGLDGAVRIPGRQPGSS